MNIAQLRKAGFSVQLDKTIDDRVSGIGYWHKVEKFEIYSSQFCFDLDQGNDYYTIDVYANDGDPDTLTIFPCSALSILYVLREGI